MKRSILIVLTLTTVAAGGVLAPAPAGAQIIDSRASRIVVLPNVPAGGAQPDITGGSSLRDDCDEILLVPESSSAAGPGSVEIALQTGPGMWWKELQLFVDGRLTQTAKSENGSRSQNVLTIMPNELATAQILFLKPKFLGVSTGVYQIVGLERLANRRVLLNWRRDAC
jgi:hypothetical protein